MLPNEARTFGDKIKLADSTFLPSLEQLGLMYLATIIVVHTIISLNQLNTTFSWYKKYILYTRNGKVA